MMRCILFLLLTLWTATAAAAQQDWSFQRAKQDYQRAFGQLIALRTKLESPIEQNLFPPESVMRHRTELKLTDTQRSALIAIMQEFQSAIVGVEWELQDAKLELDNKLAMYPTPEKEVEQALNDVFIHEASIKRRHILMLVKVKNVLDETQIELLMTKSRYPQAGLLPHEYESVIGQH